MEIIPGEEVIQVVVALTLSYNVLYPCLLDFLIVEKLEEQVYLVYVQIQHHQFHQHIVGNVLYGIDLIAPQTMRLLQFVDENMFDV